MQRIEIDKDDLQAGAHQLKFALRLQMCVEMMRSAFRLHRITQKDTADTAKTDHVVLTVCMIGWAGEGIQVFQEGVRQGKISEKMFSDNDKLLATFRWVQDTKSPEADRMRRTRDKYFAHWDKDMIADFLKSEVVKSSDGVVFQSETGGKVDSRSPLIAEIMLWDIANRADSEGDAKISIPEMGKAVFEVFDLLQTAIVAVLKSAGIRIREKH